MTDFQIHNPDLHMHSIFSDGTDTLPELISGVRAAGIDAFSLTDHDCLDGCRMMQEILQPGDPLFINGVELSCEDESGKYHILGYGYHPEKPSLQQAVEYTHALRREKAQNRMQYLESMGFRFTDAEKAKLFSLKNPGKPHFAQLLMQKGYLPDKTAAFAAVSGYHGSEEKLTPQAAITAILRSDGIPVLAHGVLADGSQKLTSEEIRSRVGNLKKMGLMGLECFYSGFTGHQQETMLHLAEEYDLLVTAGSDYHGKNKRVILGQTNVENCRRMEQFFCEVHLSAVCHRQTR